MRLTQLQLIQQVNFERFRRWFGNHPGWNLLEAAAEMCGEAGEMTNICKKIQRDKYGIQGNLHIPKSELEQKLRLEIGDVLVTLMTVASLAGLDINDCVESSFNEKSIQMGFPERI